ncbi:MAG: PAS domain S-box protein [Planctomycetales bacterium]|nr:PAS domain S-box protein [Planctomycetales bacterium]
MHDLEPKMLERAIDRERRARRQAEELLERKSRELYQVNENLKLTASALKLEAEMSRAVLETAAEGIVSFNGRGIIRSVNPAAERIFGYESNEIVGCHVEKLVPPPDEEPRQDMGEMFWSADYECSGRCIEAIGRKKDGATFEMELSGSRVQFDASWVYTWLVRDITSRRNLERQLSFSQKMESVGQLAAGIAHEINTPIQYVGDNTAFLGKSFAKLTNLIDAYRGLAERCNADGVYPELTKELAQLAKKSKLEFLLSEIPTAVQQSAEGAERVAQIVLAMKEFSHPGTREKTYVDLNKCIESTATISRNEWKYVAEMTLDLDPQLPKIACFPGDLNQAIVNLIVNASHAIIEKKAGGMGRISVSTRPYGDFVEIRISDSGTGIPAEIRDKIFDPFFTTKPVGKGTGQGLAIVYSIVVDRHGGDVQIESEVGLGTTFVLRLPLHLDHADTGASSDESAHLVCR